jgi:hypothetical protein
MALKKIRFIDLFSGIGGMRLAFESVARSLNLETEDLLSREINPDAHSVSLPVQGRRLIDYRGGNSLHSWELGLRGECSLDEIELMKSVILTR